MPPVAIVWPCPLAVDADAAAGRDLGFPRPDCPSCAGPLVFWSGHRRNEAHLEPSGHQPAAFECDRRRRSGMTAAAIPFGREYGHYSGVDPLIIPVQRVTQYALGDKADLLVDVPCARIEWSRPPARCGAGPTARPVADNHSHGLRAEAAVLPGGANSRTVRAVTIALSPFVQHDLAHALAAVLVDDRQIKPVGLLVSGACTRTEIWPRRYRPIPGSRRNYGCPSA